MAYALVSFADAGGPQAGLLYQGLVYNLAAVTDEPGYRTMRAVLEDWERAEARIETCLTRIASRGRPSGDVSLLAPLPDPGAIFCAGANYSDHVDNMARVKGVPPEPNGLEHGLYPFNFLKSARCVVGPDASVEGGLPDMDYEAELGAVIGRRTSGVSPGNALKAVAGYTIANDLSARGRMLRPAHQPGSPFRYDWVSHKNFDGACPLGPSIVPAKAVGDPQALTIRTWVNGDLRQDSSTRLMIYPLAELISQISHRMTLHPGDIVLTGTPAGVGAETGEFLQAGDVVRIEIERLGRLETRIVARAMADA